MTSLRFAILGDTHYCIRKPSRRNVSFDHVPDYVRYADMAGHVAEFAERIRQEQVEMLFSTGDLIEGHTDDAAEDTAARQILERTGARLFMSPGSHDRLTGQSQFQTFEAGSCRFILLDYTTWNAAQKAAFIAALQAGHSAEHLFVFAHPPVCPWGREFFDDPCFRKDVTELLRQYPVDLYFCGHTHNQAVSYHQPGFTQIMASSVGYTTGQAIDVRRYHALPAQTTAEFFWGTLEDSAPAYWIVACDKSQISLTWKSMQDTAQLVIPERFARPVIQKAPRMAPEEHLLHPADCNQIRTAWLSIFAAEKNGASNATVILNGIPVGTLPQNCSYANRRFLMLPEPAIQTIANTNSVQIDGLSQPPFAIGSITLELLLMDGRTIRTLPSTQYFICGEHKDFIYR